MAKQKWASRSTFILAAVGSAVGLGNAWRFPGLAAKHGGGAFLFVYLIAMLVFGIPLLMMEISIGRRFKQGAPGAMRGLNKKLEPIGWAATANAFVIVCYYAVVFAWVLLMMVMSYKFAGITGNVDSAKNLWSELIQTSGSTEGFGKIPTLCFVMLIAAWALMYWCIRDGANSVGKVVKYTVFLPVICLGIMVVKGLTMNGAVEGLIRFVVPDFSKLGDPTLWVDAVGQVFYSLSIMMAIMFAYGSFLDRKSNIAVDVIIIAFSDMAISILAGIAMFTTLGGVGMLDDMTASGIGTAFMVYPMAIVKLSSYGNVNALFGFIFYFCLATLAVDSAFSIVEGVSTAVSDRLKLDHKKTTRNICIVAGVISIVFITGAGLCWLDIVDNWTNQYNLIIIGILECVAVGWFFKPTKVLEEVNENTQKFKMSKVWFVTSIKFVAPVLLTGLFVWNLYSLFAGGGVYGGYPLWSNIIGGWCVTALVFISPFAVKKYIESRKKKGFRDDEYDWDSALANDEAEAPVYKWKKKKKK